MRASLRLRPAPLVAVVALVALAACSSGGDDPVDVVRAAPEKTIDAGTARVAINIAVASTGTTGAVTGEGAFDLQEGRGAFSLNLGAFGASFGATTLDAVLEGSTIFVRVPPQLAAAAGNKQWVRIDLSTLSQQTGVDIGSLGQLQSVDPSQALRFLEGAVDDMEEVGEEPVRGEQTTHYRGTVDLRRASAEVDADARAAVDQAIESLGTSTFPADVWVDDEGRLRKLSFEIARTDAGPQSAGRVELELYDFGTDVNAQPPPADQTTDLTSLFAGTPGRR
ncbi:MAG TPA: LppX_LprAFG lipoprotein [Acidimicrobiales bacterium]